MDTRPIVSEPWIADIIAFGFPLFAMLVGILYAAQKIADDDAEAR